jgi:ribosomal 50S subunit-associated protein YjgA (DUF615 family)
MSYDPNKYRLTPENFEAQKQEALDNLEAARAQIKQDAADTAEAMEAYQQGGEEALRELIERKAKENRPPRRPLVARRG